MGISFPLFASNRNHPPQNACERTRRLVEDVMRIGLGVLGVLAGVMLCTSGEWLLGGLCLLGSVSLLMQEKPSSFRVHLPFSMIFDALRGSSDFQQRRGRNRVYIPPTAPRVPLYNPPACNPSFVSTPPRVQTYVPIDRSRNGGAIHMRGVPQHASVGGAHPVHSIIDATRTGKPVRLRGVK